jgi:O-antigen/teichoic acid export membrane protein
VTARFDVRRTARATGFALVATALEKGGAMVLLLVIARTLGAEDFGRYAALMALLAFVQLGAELGQEPVLVRLLSQRPDAEREVLVDGALALRLACTAAGAAVVVGAGAWLLPTVGGAPIVLAAAGIVAGSALGMRAVFRAEHRLDRLCVVALANIATFALALGVTRALGLGLAGAVAAWSLGQLAASAAALLLVRRHVAARPRWDGGTAVALAGSGWALALNAVLLTITLRVGQLVVLRFAGAVESGYLAAGSRLAEAFALLPESLMLVLLPVLSAYDVDARDAQRELSVRVVRLLGVLALTVIVAVSLAAPALIGILFGAAYVPATPALRISIWLALLSATGAVFTNLLIARGLERLLLAVNLATSILTIGLSVALVPALGFVGAAAVSLAANVLSQLLLVAQRPTRGDVLACVRPLARPAAVAFVLVVAGRWLPVPPLALGAVGGFAFLVTSVALGALGPDDWALARRALGGARATTVD